MSVPAGPPPPVPPRRSPPTSGPSSLNFNNQIFLKYYKENDIFLSPEGILKFLSVIACVVSSALFLRGGACVGAPALVASSAAVALAVAAVVTLALAARALGVPLLAPQPFLYTDIIASSVCGVLLLVTGVLSLTVCDVGAGGPLNYIHGPLAIAIAGMLVGSAALTYTSAMRLWDAVAGPAVEPRPPPPQELEV